MGAVPRSQLQVWNGGSALIAYAASLLRSTLMVDRSLPSAALSTQRDSPGFGHPLVLVTNATNG
jgi:hypothetical protein